MVVNFLSENCAAWALWMDTQWTTGQYFVILTLRASLRLGPQDKVDLFCDHCYVLFSLKANKMEAFIPEPVAILPEELVVLLEGPLALL